MRNFWSVKVFKLFGIQVELHFTFLLLLILFAWVGFTNDGFLGAFFYIEMILLLFSCVLLHEFGHCFVAKYYKITVPRIVLLPIGGMAQFQRIPRAPKKELLITIAGPMVNIVIFGILYFFMGWPDKSAFTSANLLSLKGTLYFLMIINLLMGGFNLLPVFPMDGGRILRALLAFKMTYLNATRVAVIVGKALAMVGIFLAIFQFYNWLLAALFAFIYLGADAEYSYVKAQETQRQKLQNLGRPIEDDETETKTD